MSCPRYSIRRISIMTGEVRTGFGPIDVASNRLIVLPWKV